MKSSIKNSGEIQTKEPYIKCKWCIYALCSKILIVKKYEQKRGVKNELRRKVPTETREEFYALILQVMAQMGGGSANVL